MMKEVEVGDEYLGKVVKTTTFGAFVELTKGTDGLLHISNVSPGERVESVEDVLSKGDEIDVGVVEVDRERGRIGLRLTTILRSRASPWRNSRASAAAAVPHATDRAAGDRPATAAAARPAGDGERGSGRPRHGSGRDRDRDRD